MKEIVKPAPTSEQVRISVQKGVDSIVKPFLKRVDNQFSVNSSDIVIGGFGDKCKPKITR